MDKITLEIENKIAAAHLQGWSEGYNAGMKAACNYVIHCIDMEDIETIITDLKTGVVMFPITNRKRYRSTNTK